MLDYDNVESPDYESEWSDTYESYADYPEAGGWGEARRKPPPPPVKAAAGRSTYQPPRTGTDRPVTQSQLKEAPSKVSQQITINSGAIKTLDGRVRGVSDDQKKLGAFVRKDMADRKKDLDTVRRDLQQTRELSALIPMVTANATGPIATLAPLLHLVPGDVLGGGGGSSSNTGQSGSLLGGSNLLAIAAIAVASGAFA